MRALSLFSGIGGIDLAAEWAGIKTVAFCEREPFPQKVLKKHWPDVPIYDDVCTLTKERLEEDGIDCGTIELIHGGYPCQPFSNAGNRQGAEDDRHLWPEVFRLIQAIKPRWFVGENVAGHVTLGLDIVLADLESIGYAWEAFVVPASAVDARHRRDRIFIVAHSDSIGNNGQGKRRIDRDRQKEMQERFESLLGFSDNSENVANSTSIGQSRQRKLIQSINSKESREGETSKPIDVRIRDQWAVEPNVGRVANGVPGRVDRLKSLGNAVVPQQIYPLLAAIKQIDDLIRS